MNEDDLTAALRADTAALRPEPDATAGVERRVRAIHRRRRGALASGVLVIIAALVVGSLQLGGSSGSSSPGLTPAPSTGAAFDPVDLVGRWSVNGSGVESGAILRVSDGIDLFVRCGELFGTWTGDSDGHLAVTVEGYSSACGSTFSAPGGPTWLTGAATGRRTADGVQLLDAQNHVLATLVPGPAPSKRLDTAAATDVPVPSQALIARLHNTSELPSGLRPATAADVVGEWRPDPQSKAPSSLTVKADGSWVSNDGCNDSGGEWRMTAGGGLTATNGGSTLVGCAGSGVPGSWGQAARVGFDGTTMVLVGSDGRTLGRLVRDTTPACRPGQITLTSQSQGYGGSGADASDAMAVILHNDATPCLFSDTVTLEPLDESGHSLGAAVSVTSRRPALIGSAIGQTQINVNARYGRDLTTGGLCADDSVKPFALRVTGAELGEITVSMKNSLRTCKGQLDPQGFIESFGG